MFADQEEPSWNFLAIGAFAMATPALENSKEAEKTGVLKLAAHRCVVCGCCQSSE